MFKRKQTKEATSASASSEETKKKRLTNQFSSTTSDIWKKIFLEGRSAFEQAKYEDAIKLFSRTLDYEPKQITVLDCRAAAYEKNQQFDEAMKDATSVMVLSPKDSRGYLRAGKILVFQEKYSEAINIYKRALKMVPPTDTRYKTIEPLLKNTRNKKKPPPTFDFMKVLPYDIICQIFSYLSFDRRIQCMIVCRTWRQFAMNWSGMWRDLDFGRFKIPQTAMIKYINYANGRNVRRLSMREASRNTMLKVLKTLITQDCHYLETLEFDDCDIPKTEFLRTLRLMGRNVKHLRIDTSPFSFTTIVNEIIPVCPKLTHLSALNCDAEDDDSSLLKLDSTLQLLYLSLSVSSASIHIDQLTSFLKCCPQLITFKFISATHYFSDFGYSLQQACPDLENVTFSHRLSYADKTDRFDALSGSKSNSEKGWRVLSIVNDPSFNDIMLGTIFTQHHSTLEKLSLTACSSITNEMSNFDYNSYPLKRLDTLSILSCGGVTEMVLQRLLSSALSLKHIVINQSIAVNDELTDSVAPLLKLEHLDISSCPYITGRGLKKWVDMNKTTLSRLILDNCHRIAADTVTWAANELGQHVVRCRFT